VTIPRVLAIAGSDSGGGAGIQADIKTITMLGGHAMTAITAITAQNTMGVTDIMPVSTDMVLAQIDAVVRDIGVDAVKIGMIGSAETAEALAARLDPQAQGHGEAQSVQIVFDPVMVATSGVMLADPQTVHAFELLMRRATLVTPNVPELETLIERPIADLGELIAGARELASRIGTAVLAKGGHLAGDEVTDVLVSGGDDPEIVFAPLPRLDTRHDHGTGCTLSSAIATALAQRQSLPQAIKTARSYVRAAMAAAPGLGQGHGPMGHGLGRAHFTAPDE
jgi:hydroxymethylpyrimidine/phosphomethylpyrimidine kinase